MTSARVLRFMAARPSVPYTIRRVEEIEARDTAAGFPWCDECCDWHDAGEPHSMTDADT